MNKTWKVFKYELGTVLRKKSFYVVSLIIMAIIIGLMSMPRLFDTSGEETSDDPFANFMDEKVGYLVENGEENLYEEFFKQIPNYKLYHSLDEMKKAIEDDEIDKGLEIQKDGHFKLYVMDNDFGDYHQEIRVPLKEYHRATELAKAGIDYQKISEIYSYEPDLEVESIGRNSANNFIFVYGMLFVIYFVILMYGSQVATAVAREKNDRTMEILITSTTPRSLIHGKVAAYGLAGLISVLMAILAVVIGYFLNADIYEKFLNLMQFQFGAKEILLYLGFFLFGYLTYLYLYAAMGSLVSKVEDVQQSMMPIMILFIIGYIATVFGMQFPHAALFDVMTYIPFFSVMTMLVKIFLTSAPLVEILISLAILIVTTYLMAKLSIKLYRMGSLNYGNKMSLFSVFKKDKRPESK